MNVFITGATGYIGWSVASAYRRAGHEVRGLVRSEEKALKSIDRCADIKPDVLYRARGKPSAATPVN